MMERTSRAGSSRQIKRHSDDEETGSANASSSARVRPISMPKLGAMLSFKRTKEPIEAIPDKLKEDEESREEDEFEEDNAAFSLYGRESTTSSVSPQGEQRQVRAQTADPVASSPRLHRFFGARSFRRHSKDSVPSDASPKTKSFRHYIEARRSKDDQSEDSSASPHSKRSDVRAALHEELLSFSPKARLFGARSFRSHSKEGVLSKSSPRSTSFRHDNETRRSKDDTQTEAPKRPESQRIPRKPSKLQIIFGKSERPQIVAMTDEMIRLETVLQSDKGRHRLVQELLALKGDYVVRVRFCSAVDKFDAVTDEKERATLAQMLIHTFLMHGCMFFISALSDARAHAIAIEGNYNQLVDAKREVLESLSTDDNVMRCVDFIETLDGL